MDEMPGMIRPYLQALPQVKERIFSPHLFPACAGVILAAGTRRAAIAAFPRTCGGNPKPYCQAWQPEHFSPHTRG